MLIARGISLTLVYLDFASDASYLSRLQSFEEAYVTNVQYFSQNLLSDTSLYLDFCEVKEFF